MNGLWKAGPLLPTATLGLALLGMDAFAGDAQTGTNIEAVLARTTPGQAAALHAALFFTTVWIVSSLRIHRLRALWRVGPGLKAMRGFSSRLLAGVPKTRAALGGSRSGAGASGMPAAKQRAARERSVQEESMVANAVLDNFRS